VMSKQKTSEENMRVDPNTAKRCLITVLLAVVSIFALPAVAQTYPTKPVRIIVPYRQGGCTGSRRGGWCWGGDGARPPGSWHSILRRLLTAIFAAAFIFAPPAVAQTYPTKPVRIIVPYSPGGGIDTVARMMAQKLTEQI